MSFLPLLRVTAPLIAFAIASSAQHGAQVAETSQSGAQGATQTAGATVRSVASLVVVDVVVRDDGKPVRGLQRQAFHIFEDGREQTIKIFEEHNSADASQIQSIPPLPANTYSNFPETTVTTAANVLLLDALNTPTKDQMSVRQQMIEYLRNVPAGSRIAIFTLASRLRIVQGFTADRTALLAALSSKRNGPSESPVLPDPDDASLTKLDADMAGLGASSQVMDSLLQFQADQAAFQMDLRVGMTLDALKQLAGYLGGIPGRKNLIWFSGSFPLSLDPDPSLSNEFSAARVYGDQIRATNDLLTTSRVAVYPIDARGLFPSSVFSASNPNSNYSGVSRGAPGGMNPGGGGAGGVGGGGRRTRLPSSGTTKTNPNAFAGDASKFVQTTAAEHATMQQIAQETGGQAFYDTNAIKAAIASAIEDGENYYTLAYTPGDLHFDGKFRKIQVQVSDQNYRLAYRPGYFADSPTDHASNAPLNPSAGAIQRGAPPASQILFKVRVLPSDDPALKGLASQPGPAGLMADKLRGPVKRYWMDSAIDMHQVAVAVGPDGLHHSAIEFVVIAYDHDGKILNVATRSFKLNLQPAQYDQIMQTGLPLHEEIDVPTGEVFLRIGVHDLSTDRVGSIEIPLRAGEMARQK
jgi:VWFA-related protein